MPVTPPPVQRPQGQRPQGQERYLAVAAGGAVFLALNTFLFLSRCTSTEFMINCGGGQGRHTAAVIVLIVLVILAAIFTDAGRRFAKGFIGALVILGVVTMGSCTPSWLDPYYVVKTRTAPVRAQWKTNREEAARREEWIAAMNARDLDVSRGVDLASAVLVCARSFARTKDRPAATESELLERCTEFRDYAASVEPLPRRAYIIPVDRPDDARGEMFPEIRGDAGWRATYRLTATGYEVDVAPEARLKHNWPRIHGDDDSGIEITLSESSAPIPVSPVADLQTMVRCLREIPAEEERRHAQRVLGGWVLTNMTKRLCPELASRVQFSTPNDKETTSLSVVIPAGPKGGPAVAAVYTVKIELRQAAPDNFAFDLTASPKLTWGLRRYLARSDGSIHWTVEGKAATPDDPVVSR